MLASAKPERVRLLPVSNTVQRQAIGLTHVLTLAPVLMIGTLVPIVGKWFVDAAWPEQPNLIGAASIGLSFVGCLLTWAAGRWLGRRWADVDPRLPLLLAAIFVNLSFLKTEAPIPLMIASFVVLSLPAVSLWFGLGLTRWSWGRYRFVPIWLINFGLVIGFVVMAMLVDEAQPSDSVKDIWGIGYTVMATIVAVLAGRALRHRWQQDSPHWITVLAPALLLSLVPFMADMPLIMRALLAVLMVTPLLGFSAALIGFRRRRVA